MGVYITALSIENSHKGNVGVGVVSRLKPGCVVAATCIYGKGDLYYGFMNRLGK